MMNVREAAIKTVSQNMMKKYQICIICMQKTTKMPQIHKLGCLIKAQSLSSVVSQIASYMFYSSYAKSREVGIVQPDQRFIVILIKRAAAVKQEVTTAANV